MTGTGTQADPYIPATLTEFITAVGTSGAYVALETDINAADDPDYGGELGSEIVLQCTEMDGREHKIRGITVRAGYFFRQPNSAACKIKNVDMLDMCHKKTNNVTVSLAGNANNYAVFERVRLSIKIDIASQQQCIDLGDCIYPFYSAFFVEYTGTGHCDRALFRTCTVGQSTIYIKNVASSNGVTVQYNNWFARDAFIIDAPRSNVILTSRNNSPRDYCYYAVINCDSDITVNCGEAGVTDLVTTDDDSIAVTLASGWTRCSIDQLKGKDYLSSIGWLP